MARSRNTADTQTASGGPVSPFIAGKNAIINGAMDVWQRGTTVSVTTTGQYTADRWITFNDNNTRTLSRQLTNDTTNLPNIQYCARFQRPASDTTTGRLMFGQGLETSMSFPFIGKVVTLSFYARKGANFSGASDALTVLIMTGTGTDQNIMVGYTGQVNNSTTVTLTTTWQRFTYTITVPTTATEIGFQVGYTPVGTAGANDYYEITGCQLELGSSATPFSRAGGTIQGELAACQRYYQKSFPIGTTPADNTGWDGAVGSSNSYAQNYFTVAQVRFPVQMRTSPTLTYYNFGAVNANKVRDAGGINYPGYTQIGPEPRGFSIAVNTTNFPGGGTLGAIHYTAEAEL